MDPIFFSIFVFLIESIVVNKYCHTMFIVVDVCLSVAGLHLFWGRRPEYESAHR
jgi:hypothetical protein